MATVLHCCFNVCCTVKFFDRVIRFDPHYFLIDIVIIRFILSEVGFSLYIYLLQIVNLSHYIQSVSKLTNFVKHFLMSKKIAGKSALSNTTFKIDRRQKWSLGINCI